MHEVGQVRGVAGVGEGWGQVRGAAGMCCEAKKLDSHFEQNLLQFEGGAMILTFHF